MLKRKSVTDVNPDRKYNQNVSCLNTDLNDMSEVFMSQSGLINVKFCNICCKHGKGIQSKIKSIKDFGFKISDPKCKSITLHCTECGNIYCCKDKDIIKWLRM